MLNCLYSLVFNVSAAGLYQEIKLKLISRPEPSTRAQGDGRRRAIIELCERHRMR